MNTGRCKRRTDNVVINAVGILKTKQKYLVFGLKETEATPANIVAMYCLLLKQKLYRCRYLFKTIQN